MSNATLGYQTFFQRGDGGSPESFNTVEEVISISGPDFTADVKDVTNMSSPGNAKELIPGLLSPGQLAVECNWNPATNVQQSGLLTDATNRTKRNFKIVLPPSIGKTWSSTGYVTGVKFAHPVDDKITATITISLSGLPTIA